MPKARLVTSLPVAAVVCLAGFVAPVSAQRADAVDQPVAQIASAGPGELQGVVADDRGAPLPGAVVSALGVTTAFAVTDQAGRFAFRTLPPGPYLVRAHLTGYVPARGRIIQVSTAARAVSTLTLARRGGPNEPAQIIAAGVGGADVPMSTPVDPGEDTDDHSETAWRLRHLKRSVLKEASPGAVIADADEDEDSFWEDSVDTLGRAMGQSARLATSLFADLPVTGQVNFLTTTSFDQPQELFSTTGGPPRGVALISLDAPAGAGDWNVRGAMTQGDLSSWVVAGSYVRRAMNAHRYEAGLSYSMQRYEGGNPAALVAVTDGSRRAASLYAYDDWALDPRVSLTYGARYSRYDYLQDDALFSPRVGVTVAPIDGERSLRIRAAATRREIAPGAEEFMPSASLGVWLPPERTFSPLSPRDGFRPERVDHIEIAGEQDIGDELMIGVRAFRQSVNDQIITLFGVSRPGSGIPEVGHYYVASGGDLETRGWGVSVSRTITGRVRGSIDYTQTEAHWSRLSPEVEVLSVVARSALRQDMERVHDLTTSVHTEIPITDTRVFVLYKLNSAFAAADPGADRGFGARFDVQVNQALPFLDFTCAQWEALFTVRNLFRDDLLEASIYDELLVIKPPKRVVGGLTVRF